MLARTYDIGLNIDAEESDRLELSLDLLEALCASTRRFRRLGRHRLRRAGLPEARAVRAWTGSSTLRAAAGHRLMVRLVKGAYWDSEIKRAQVDGLEGFPVFTRKLHTDVSYLACARKLLAAPDAVFPQFATHNAYTLAAIHSMAGDGVRAPGIRVPMPARHGRAAVRGGGRPQQAEPPRAASTPRSARTRRCSPTWCAGCWRTGPTRPSSTGSRTRHCRAGGGGPGRRPGGPGRCRRSRMSGSPCRGTCSRRCGPTPPGST